MKKAFGEQIAEHRKQFVMMDNPLTQAPQERQEWDGEQATPHKLELMRYNTSFGDLDLNLEQERE